MMLRLTLTSLLLALTALATTDLLGQSGVPDRKMISVKWNREVLVQGALDSELLRPELMAARGSVVYVYDYGDNAVKCFDKNGALVWRFGRGGRGPGEFVNPTDLQVDQDEQVWLTDPALSRVTVISSTGSLVRSVQTASVVERLLPSDDGSFFAYAHTGSRPTLQHLSAGGQVIGTFRLPAWMDTVPSLVSELRVAASPDGKVFAAGSYYSGRLLVKNANEPLFRPVAAIETHNFPKPIVYAASKSLTVRRLPPDARPTIRSLAADNRFLYALVHGRSDQRGRIVDLYRLDDGGYHGSMLLPQAVASIALTDGGVAALVIDPFPSILLFKFTVAR